MSYRQDLFVSVVLRNFGHYFLSHDNSKSRDWLFLQIRNTQISFITHLKYSCGLSIGSYSLTYLAGLSFISSKYCFYVRVFRIQNLMVTWFTNLRHLYEGMIIYFQFRKIITRYRRIGYNLNVMRQSACLVLKPIMVDNYAALF